MKVLGVGVQKAHVEEVYVFFFCPWMPTENPNLKPQSSTSQPTMMAYLENLLTSYRLGKPRNSKIPRNIPKRDCPKYLFRYPPGNSKNTKFVCFRYFLVFSGYFFDLVVQGEFGCRGGISGLFWGLGGFLFCSWPIGSQGLPQESSMPPPLKNIRGNFLAYSWSFFAYS